ncbi:MAG: hypothetical protein M1840_004349 [Geoglossum simile]|nr:MAG: hypothetical protein M1840_004349 [Geoglossum simile]
MANVNLTSVLAALAQTGESDEWNAYKGVTCLAPISAFNTTDNTTLTHLLDAHTIKSAQYTPHLRDGQVFNSRDNTSITVSVRGGDVWFGDAKVVRGNVVSNNGVIHVLDKAITPNSTAKSTSTPSSPSSTPPSSTPTKKSLGNPNATIHSSTTMLLLFIGSYLAFAFA